jgi:hypothetical protein
MEKIARTQGVEIKDLFGFAHLLAGGVKVEEIELLSAGADEEKRMIMKIVRKNFRDMIRNPSPVIPLRTKPQTHKRRLPGRINPENGDVNDVKSDPCDVPFIYDARLQVLRSFGDYILWLRHLQIATNLFCQKIIYFTVPGHC